MRFMVILWKSLHLSFKHFFLDHSKGLFKGCIKREILQVQEISRFSSLYIFIIDQQPKDGRLKDWILFQSCLKTMLKNEVSGYPIKFGFGSCNINYYTLRGRGWDLFSGKCWNILSQSVLYRFPHNFEGAFSRVVF